MNPFNVDVHREQNYDTLLNRDNELLRIGELRKVFNKAWLASKSADAVVESAVTTDSSL